VWWVSLGATAVCGLTAYVAVLPLVLPRNERSSLMSAVTRMGERFRSTRTPTPLG
jgi:hypothetical protein